MRWLPLVVSLSVVLLSGCDAWQACSWGAGLSDGQADGEACAFEASRNPDCEEGLSYHTGYETKFCEYAEGASCTLEEEVVALCRDVGPYFDTGQ